MIYLTIILSVWAVCAVLAYIVRTARDERRELLAERGQLLERIQRPERPIVQTDAPPVLVPDLEPDEVDLVGTINYAEGE